MNCFSEKIELDVNMNDKKGYFSLRGIGGK
jgi:hypothetical protein